MAQNKGLAVFQGKKIRRTWHNEEWWFSVVDIVEVLTESVDAKDYWYRLKVREKEASGTELSTNCRQLKLKSTDNKFYKTDCTNTKGAFRIIQSIPSKKAEPFKLWLAKVGYDRVKEIENPELAQERMKELYEKKGYSREWVDKRLRGIAIRQTLTDEWKNRNIEAEKDFAILTAEISKATFDLTPNQYKKHKSLTTQNLRDHMDDMELVLTMLGEATTTKITQVRDSQKFPELKNDAKDGGKIAGDTRKNIENKIGQSVVSKENYLTTPEKQKRLEQKSNKKLNFKKK
jgi:DNA-damage-inducible protein D